MIEKKQRRTLTTTRNEDASTLNECDILGLVPFAEKKPLLRSSGRCRATDYFLPDFLIPVSKNSASNPHISTHWFSLSLLHICIAAPSSEAQPRGLTSSEQGTALCCLGLHLLELGRFGFLLGLRVDRSRLVGGGHRELGTGFRKKEGPDRGKEKTGGG